MARFSRTSAPREFLGFSWVIQASVISEGTAGIPGTISSSSLSLVTPALEHLRFLRLGAIFVSSLISSRDICSGSMLTYSDKRRRNIFRITIRRSYIHQIEMAYWMYGEWTSWYLDRHRTVPRMQQQSHQPAALPEAILKVSSLF